ncbi:hypothetical protein M436DRAFT_85406 [Aureobasidium namibiae CBS 147.97]|uniref:Uncharacterized protein n=1 Tax=Aureobasidium namibiae CBS 147.97 TaxID=1043004 RepID=A0A074X4K7_9PEZI|nr:uncharacterized protein M436DRAFT_85406 [Aureobasidium namibiae CBS 147.97]KEQ69531.1 hypothetical protein M436DRAFT_85406 [Aureobasidium namibiae CBS 147.97]
MAKRELTSASQPTSSGSGKRSCMDGSEKQASHLTSPAPAEDFEGLHDMWDEPLAVSKDTWAVTRCVSDHGNTITKWTAGHFVAVAMWSGGLEAGIQAAKAIRIFGIWSPHADYRLGEPPPLSRVAARSDILGRLWPTVESTEDHRLLEWANQRYPGNSFTDFATAHRHLLRECIGPDLTKFPTVVRPNLDYHNGAPLVWKRLVTIEQFWDTLAPVLRKHFDAEVDLDTIALKIQPAAMSRSTKDAYGGSRGFETHMKAKSGGHYWSSRGNHRESNMIMTDDHQDDDEEFDEKPKLKIEVEPTLLKDNIGRSRERLNSTRQGGSGTKNLFAKTTHARRYRPILPRSSSGTYKYSSSYGPANSGAVQPVTPSFLVIEEPQPVYYQVVNQLYEQSCGVSVDQITYFRDRHNAQLDLPQAWKKICDYRKSNNMRTLGVRDRLPHPRVFSCATSRSNAVSKPGVEILKGDLDEVLRQNAKNDLSKFEKFCQPVILLD